MEKVIESNLGVESFEWPTEPGKIAMGIMGAEGDLKKIWDRNNQDEVDDAKASFNRLTKEKRYLAFRVNKDGEKGEQMREFDPHAERMILTPPLQGG